MTKKNNNGKTIFKHSEDIKSDEEKNVTSLKDEADLDMFEDESADKVEEDDWDKDDDGDEPSDSEKDSASKRSAKSGKMIKSSSSEPEKDKKKASAAASKKKKNAKKLRKPPVTGKSSNSRKRAAKKPEVKVFDKASVMFYLVSLVAVLALIALATNILAPETFRKIVKSTPLDRGDVVMTIGDYEVTADEYIYEFLLLSDDYDSRREVDNFLKKNPSEEKKAISDLEQHFIQKYSQVKWAESMGIYMTDADRARVDAQIAQRIEEIGGYDAFLRGLDRSYCTEETYYRLAYIDEHINMLFAELKEGDFSEVSDAEVAQFIQDREIYRAKHILITLTGDEAVDAEKKALAENILRRIRNGEDFDTLMNTYSEDTAGLEANPDGYTFDMNTNFVPEFKNTTKELAIDEVSDLVEVHTQGYSGYHIIKRVEVDPEPYFDMIREERFNSKLSDIIDSIKITYGRGYNLISIENIKWDFKYPPAAAQVPPPSGILGKSDDNSDEEDTSEENSEGGGNQTDQE